MNPLSPTSDPSFIYTFTVRINFTTMHIGFWDTYTVRVNFTTRHNGVFRFFKRYVREHLPFNQPCLLRRLYSYVVFRANDIGSNLVNLKYLKNNPLNLFQRKMLIVFSTISFTVCLMNT
jgi:hypothetical protein